MSSIHNQQTQQVLQYYLGKNKFGEIDLNNPTGTKNLIKYLRLESKKNLKKKCEHTGKPIINCSKCNTYVLGPILFLQKNEVDIPNALGLYARKSLKIEAEAFKKHKKVLKKRKKLISKLEKHESLNGLSHEERMKYVKKREKMSAKLHKLNNNVLKSGFVWADPDARIDGIKDHLLLL